MRKLLKREDEVTAKQRVGLYGKYFLWDWVYWTESNAKTISARSINDKGWLILEDFNFQLFSLYAVNFLDYDIFLMKITHKIIKFSI